MKDIRREKTNKKVMRNFFFNNYLELSFRIVPIFLSERVSLPFAFRIVPFGNPRVFSKVPTVQSLLVFLTLMFISPSYVLLINYTVL